ncbi:MAG: hypothetical protein HOB40_10885 [Candidatus Marinimicrobia bacterium]|jgi:hypothetical protein|nr:hypothetical protein [Candidatus Neomarinimicrobiota bacterium]MBT3840050.1 hypothetical protein [Candidatus Neomarinimicrobiota bacterium]MBT4000082.1 hypothetical protein [Candidatus Neomarinimicrobiota bacterium]MBT4282119.1 hypothetical protein [Candidatus Neomarinimicrobiota bacterium]MBT4578858.1 hypothetical protein [Candidatus Neomarinimicrobiota bacterium]
MKKITLLIFILFSLLFGNDIENPKLFIECKSCSQDFIKEKISYLNFVRDRHDADIHILETTQNTGAGGKEHTIIFLGQFDFDGKNDTLNFISNVDDSDDQIRSERVRLIQIGLVPYLLKTSVLSQMSININQEIVAKKITTDKWNNWVYSISGNGFLNAQQSSNSLNTFGKIKASRITEDWKISLSLGGSYNENEFDFDGEEYISTSESKKVRGSIIKSLTNHLSIGIWSSVWSSSYGNTNIGISLTPKIEYNIFPYSESNQQALRLVYSIGGEQVNYADTTIYFKIQESLYSEGLSISYSTVKPWGSVNTSLSGNHYFHDFSKNILSLNTGLSLRLIKGLSLNIMGSGSMVHNQLSIPKGDYSIEDVLLERAELETQFTYFASIGLSYSFGSIYNNVVNSRFGGGGNRMSYSYGY